METEREYSEDERIAYWKEQFPSGRFRCIHCLGEFDLMGHRKGQQVIGAAPNKCTCGAFLALDGIDSVEWNKAYSEGVR